MYYTKPSKHKKIEARCAWNKFEVTAGHKETHLNRGGSKYSSDKKRSNWIYE